MLFWQVTAPLSPEILSVTVPGGCRSQGCHGYLLRSLVAPFLFFRYLPLTHLLLMGLNALLSPMGVIYFKHFWRGVLSRDGGAYLRGGTYLIPQKTIVSVPHKELECKVKIKVQVQELGGHRAKDQTQIQTSSWWINQPGSVHKKFYSCCWLIQSIILLVNNNKGEEGELINYLHLKREGLLDGGLIWEGGGGGGGGA